MACGRTTTGIPQGALCGASPCSPRSSTMRGAQLTWQVRHAEFAHTMQELPVQCSAHSPNSPPNGPQTSILHPTSAFVTRLARRYLWNVLPNSSERSPDLLCRVFIKKNFDRLLENDHDQVTFFFEMQIFEKASLFRCGQRAEESDRLEEHSIFSHYNWMLYQFLALGVPYRWSNLRPLVDESKNPIIRSSPSYRKFPSKNFRPSNVD